MHLSVLDIVVILAYLAGIVLFGILSGGRQRSARDYFLSDAAVPWWAVCFAIVATETSAITFLSIPGVAYAGNLSFLQVTVGYILGRFIVSRYFLPRYFQGELSTAYVFLETRFGPATRRTASVTFMGTRVFADGVRLYTTAIPLALFLQGSSFLPAGDTHTAYVVAIAAMAALTLAYVYFGGVRAVIWTDVIQFGVYILGAAAALAILAAMLGDGLDAGLSRAFAAGKGVIFPPWPEGGFLGFFSTPYTTIASIAGGMFLSMASHGTDHLLIQRVLTTNDLRASQRAMSLSGIIVLMQFAVFLAVGLLLWIFYNGAPNSANEVFARFILDHLPSGVKGLIVAAILAAAMSTLSGSISALSSATIMDIWLPLSGKTPDDATLLRRSRAVSIVWCLVLVLVASLFIQTPATVIELALGIASYTYGALLGVFLLGLLFRHTQQSAAIAGFFTAIAGMAAVILFTPIAWTWYVLLGSAMCIGTGLATQTLLPRPQTRT